MSDPIGIKDPAIALKERKYFNLFDFGANEHIKRRFVWAKGTVLFILI